MVELEHARALLEQMGLQTAAQLLDAQLEQSLHTQQTYVQFLNELLSSEQQQRQRKSRETRLKLARLPHRKGLEDFDFAFQPSIDKRQVEELGTLAFVAREENVILLGPPGVGKTHLAVGLALRALDAGTSTRVRTTAATATAASGCAPATEMWKYRFPRIGRGNLSLSC